MKPILFNTEMVKALLEGRKTMTRRLLKPQPTWSNLNMRWDWGKIAWWRDNWNPADSITEKNMPYKPGDILYVRETFTEEGGRYYYRADFESDWLDPCETLSGGYPASCRYRNCDNCCAESERIRWRPSIHMPKELARIFLRVKSVRVEQLQAITDEDAIKEGVPDEWPMDAVYCPICKGEGLVGDIHPATLGYREVDCPHCEKAVTRFANLWNSTIKPGDNWSAQIWDANPWVWVIEFERINKEEALK